MANLAPRELFKPNRGRATVFLHKYKSGDSFELVGGGRVKLKYDKDIAAVIKSENLLAAKKLVLVDTKGNFYTLSSFAKTKEFGGGGTKGDVAEGILGAAIAARFTNKNEEITAAHIKAIIAGMAGTGTKRETMFKSPNANLQIVDDVKFFLALAPANMDALCDQKNWPGMNDIFLSAIKYANGTTVREWSELLYYNNQYNFIQIISNGLGGQKTTKVDVRVIIDNESSNINNSLKAGDVKQFGQIGGVEFGNQRNLWGKLANINIESAEQKYHALMAKGEAIEALWLSYETAKEEINRSLGTANTRKKFLKSLADGINYFATLGEKEVTLVQLTHNEAKIYNFDQIQNALDKIDGLEAIVMESSGKPKLVIRDKLKRNLLEIRAKQENKSNGTIYIRNYIEKGKLLGELIATLA